MSRYAPGAVVVSGASQNIGRAIAERLGAEGFTVVATARNADALDEVCSSIRSAGGRAHAFATDISDPVQIRELAMAATDAAGPILALVNNAAYLPAEALVADQGVLETEDWVWDGHWDVDVRGTTRMIQAFLPGMLEAGQGSIVNIGSMLGAQPLPGRQVAYGVCKAAIDMLTRHVAVTYGARGVRCNGVSPGSIITEKQRELYSEDELARKLTSYPSPRLGAPEDVASAVSYLVQPESVFVNGQIVAVDGGITNKLVL
ncbi:MAG: SDR family oxidoreductase [Mycetocola sp.]